MLTQREMGGDVKDYWKVGSVGQNEVLRTMSVLSEYPKKRSSSASTAAACRCSLTR